MGLVKGGLIDGIGGVKSFLFTSMSPNARFSFPFFSPPVSFPFSFRRLESFRLRIYMQKYLSKIVWILYDSIYNRTNVYNPADQNTTRRIKSRPFNFNKFHHMRTGVLNGLFICCGGWVLLVHRSSVARSYLVRLLIFKLVLPCTYSSSTNIIYQQIVGSSSLKQMSRYALSSSVSYIVIELLFIPIIYTSANFEFNGFCLMFPSTRHI